MDKVNKEKLFICLWKPATAKTLFQSLFGITFGSVCIYYQGYLFGFKWDSDAYKKRWLNPRIVQRKFVTINTGVDNPYLMQHLDDLVGMPAGFFRIRCVCVIKDILAEIDPGLAPGFLGCIPSVYGWKVINWRRKQ